MPFKSSPQCPFETTVRLRCWEGSLARRTLRHRRSALEAAPLLGSWALAPAGNRRVLVAWLLPGPEHVRPQDPAPSRVLTVTAGKPGGFVLKVTQ